MARSKKKPVAKKPVVDEPAPETTPGRPARRIRDVRPWVYAGFDFLIAGVWAYLQATLMPNRHPWASFVMWSLAVLPAVLGVCMFVRNRWGWRVATGSATALLIIWVVLLITILAASAYLQGVYGSFGKAAAMGTLTMALVSFNVIAMIPALQLKFVLTRAGRKHFRLEPLWR
jgi:hypothetical protein